MRSVALYIFATLALVVSTAEGQTGSFKISIDDFKTLYNEYATGQPALTPWAGSFWAYKRDGIATLEEGRLPASPAQKYDDIFYPNQDGAQQWEMKNHSCREIQDADLKKGCEAWWGHCNAWSAASIKEPEPRTALEKFDKKFSVADQKAYLTEIYMSSGSLFAGTTQKSTPTSYWVYADRLTADNLKEGFSDSEIKKILEKAQDVANERDRWGVRKFDAFWDVSPRSFFLLFTNYIGAMKVGLVIDQFAGDQVWNQPIVGYRILPIRFNGPDSDIGVTTNSSGQAVNHVRLRVKIYWAHDGVWGDHISAPFDISKTSDSETLETFGNDYVARLIKFKLFFDQPVTGKDGKVVTAGNMIGGGLWGHQENYKEYLDDLRALNKTHPDFIWMPTELISGGQANPFVKASHVYTLLGRDPEPTPIPIKPPLSPPPQPTPSPEPVPIYTKVQLLLEVNTMFGFLSGDAKRVEDLRDKIGDEVNKVWRRDLSLSNFEMAIQKIEFDKYVDAGRRVPKDAIALVTIQLQNTPSNQITDLIRKAFSESKHRLRDVIPRNE